MKFDWQTKARCRDFDPELFFPNGGVCREARAQTEEAKKVCGGCQVIDECEKWAARALPEFGVFAGLDPADRRARWGKPTTAYHVGKRPHSGARSAN